MANPLRTDQWEYIPAIASYNRQHALDDYTAFERYEKFRWVYDKLSLHQKFNRRPSFKERIPEAFIGEYILKPRISLNGLGRKVRPAQGLTVPPGFIAQPRLSGVYRSMDFLISDQEPELLYTYRARTTGLGEFYIFWKSACTTSVAWQLARHLQSRGYRGYLNTETIGNQLLEAHLRPALQFHDRPKYSIVFRKAEDGVAVLNPDWEPPLTLESILSVQKAWDHNTPLSRTDPNEKNLRFLVVNANNLRDGYYYGNIYASQIVWHKPGSIYA